MCDCFSLNVIFKLTIECESKWKIAAEVERKLYETRTLETRIKLLIQQRSIFENRNTELRNDF